MVRAFGSHPRGQGFEPPRLHHNKKDGISRLFCYHRIKSGLEGSVVNDCPGDSQSRPCPSASSARTSPLVSTNKKPPFVYQTKEVFYNDIRSLPLPQNGTPFRGPHFGTGDILFVSSPKARYTKKYDIALCAMIYACGV